MESFAAVVRTLLHRIRAIQAAGPPGRRPAPTSVAPRDGRLYEAPPTTWGVAAHPEPGSGVAPPPAGDRARDAGPGRPPARRGLALEVYALPVPRGLPAT